MCRPDASITAVFPLTLTISISFPIIIIPFSGKMAFGSSVMWMEVPVPPMLVSGEEENIVEAAIGGMAIVEGLEGVVVSSSVWCDITWANSFSVLITRDDHSILVGNWKVVIPLVPNTVKPD